MRVERAIDHYLRHLTIERGLSRNTLLAYGRDLNRYREWLSRHGITEVEAIRETEVQSFVGSLREGHPASVEPTHDAAADVPPGAAPAAVGALALSSVARVLSTVRSFHRFLFQDGVLGEDVARVVRPPKLPSRLPKAISVAQMTALLESTPSDDLLALRDRALLETLYATGARISEVVGLDVDDIHDDAEVVRVLGKGSKQRVVPVGQYARAAISSYLVRARPQLASRGRATPALFLGARGGRLSRQGAWLIIQAAADRAGLSAHISPHTFRHSFATHLLAGGADVRVVQDLLGHASVTTTQVYTQVTVDSLIEMYQHAHPRAR